MRKAPALVVVLGVFAALVTTVPIGYLAVRLIQGWQAALAEILRFRTLELLGNTGLLVLAVTASALVIGFSQAWLTTKTNVVFAAGFAVSAALPLAIPSYVMALSYISIFKGLSGFFAAWLVLTLATSPLVFLAVTAALARLDGSSEEVARTLGFGKLQVLFKVTWPQVRTAATASGLLVAIYVLGEFGAIALLRYDTFTRAIYNAYRGSFDRTSAAALAVVLLLITMLVIWFERKYRGGYVVDCDFQHSSADCQPGYLERSGQFEFGSWGALGCALGIGAACRGGGHRHRHLWNSDCTLVDSIQVKVGPDS